MFKFKISTSRLLVFFTVGAALLSQQCLGDSALSPKIFAQQELAASHKNYGATLCHHTGYHCVSVESGDTWAELWPDFQSREKIMRLNRTNVALMYRDWVVVPDHIDDMPYMALSPLPKRMNTKGKKLLYISLAKFAFGAYDSKGNLVYWGPVSAGANHCRDVGGSCLSKTGHFTVYRMHGKNCVSGKYPLETHGGAPMPYCMYYYKGFAIHGSTLSGFINRSAGCIRLFYDDAKWLNHHFVKIGTRVIVKG